MKRRRLLITGVLLLGGAIVNVAVAWGLAMVDPVVKSPQYWHGKGSSYSEWRDWRYIRFFSGTGRGRARASCSWCGKDANIDASFIAPIDPPDLMSITPNWALPVLPTNADNSTAIYTRVLDLRGWPALALQSVFESCLDTKNTMAYSEPKSFRGAIALPNRSTTLSTSSPRMLPLRPIFPGFTINTIFYAAILWLLFFVPGKLKRTLRRRRGLCPACAYPIGTSPVCTECGIYLSGGYQW